MKANRFITADECDARAEKILRDAELYPSERRPRVKIDILAEGYKDVKLDRYAKISQPNVLGVTRFIDTAFQISIDENLTKRYDSNSILSWEESLWRTTLAHELGHIILHSDILMSRGPLVQAQLFRCTSSHMRTKPGKDDYDQVEYQANMMMASLLMPKKLVMDAHASASIATTNPHEITVDLALDFEVSMTAMGIRLKELHLD